jgi:hypothetical protein
VVRTDDETTIIVEDIVVDAVIISAAVVVGTALEVCVVAVVGRVVAITIVPEECVVLAEVYQGLQTSVFGAKLNSNASKKYVIAVLPFWICRLLKTAPTSAFPAIGKL